MRRSAAILAASAALAALTPMPAFAKAEPAPTMRAGEIAAKLNDPAMQSALTGMIAAFTKAMLDMPAAPFVKAMGQASGKPLRDVSDDARLGDLAGADADKLNDQIATHVPQAMAAMGALAVAAEAMAPQLEQIARQMRDALPKR
jgi:hypothetical protein